jgi:hypothetical protein
MGRFNYALVGQGSTRGYDLLNLGICIPQGFASPIAVRHRNIQAVTLFELGKP